MTTNVCSRLLTIFKDLLDRAEKGKIFFSDLVLLSLTKHEHLSVTETDPCGSNSIFTTVTPRTNCPTRSCVLCWRWAKAMRYNLFVMKRRCLSVSGEESLQVSSHYRHLPPCAKATQNVVFNSTVKHRSLSSSGVAQQLLGDWFPRLLTSFLSLCLLLTVLHLHRHSPSLPHTVNPPALHAHCCLASHHVSRTVLSLTGGARSPVRWTIERSLWLTSGF